MPSAPRWFLPVAAVALVLCAPLTGTARPAAEDAQKAIQGAYDRMDAALRLRDTRGAFAHYTPDFVVTYQGQQFTLAQQRASATKLMNRAAQVRSTTRIRKATATGTTATVTATNFFRATLKAEGKLKGGSVNVTALSEDTWVKSGGIWRLKRSRMTEQTMNGDAEM